MEIRDLTASDKRVECTLTVEGGYQIRFRAEDIRRERTGIHAKVYLGVNNNLMAWDNFNVERNADRLRLGNSAHKLYPEALRVLYSSDQLKHDLDLFATLIWPKWVETLSPSFYVGLPERIKPEFALQPYIIRGGGTIIFGPPERMKTMTAMTMAICIDAGLDFPFAAQQAPILYVNLERPDGSMQRRLGDLNRALGLQPDRPLLMLNARGKSLADVEDGIARAVKEEGVQVGFLDSISRAGYGDLIDNRVANQTIDILNGLFASWVGIAHSPRNDATHMFGSMHFEAGADLIIQLLTEYNDNRIGVGLQVVKSNDMARPPLGTVGYEFDDYGVARIWAPSMSDFPELMAINSTRGGLGQEIKQYLLGVGAAHAEDIAKAINRSRGSVAKILSASKDFVVVEREGHKLMYGVIEKPEAPATPISIQTL
jgi:hypothetical protein